LGADRTLLAERKRNRFVTIHRSTRPENRPKNGSVAEYVGQNGAFQQQAGESVTRGDRRRRELEARSSSPPLARLLPESLAASGDICARMFKVLRTL